MLVVSILQPHDGSAVPPPERLIPAAIAVLIAWRTRNVALTLAGGMVSLWICAWVFNYL